MIHIGDDRIPKILEVGKHNAGRPWLRHKNKFRSKLKSLEMPLDCFENRVKERKDERKTCHLALASFFLFSI